MKKVFILFQSIGENLLRSMVQKTDRSIVQKSITIDGPKNEVIDLVKSFWIDWNIFHIKTKTIFSVLRFYESVKKLTDRFAKTKRDRSDKKVVDRFQYFISDRWVKKLVDRFGENNSYRSAEKQSDRFAVFNSCRSDQKSILFLLLKVVSLKRIWVKNKPLLELNKALYLPFFKRSFDYCIFFTAN